MFQATIRLRPCEHLRPSHPGDFPPDSNSNDISNKFTGDGIRTLVLDPDHDVAFVGRSSRSSAKDRSPGKTNAFFENPVISRRHAQISLDPGKRITIVDTESMHGTYVDGVRIPPGEPYALKHGTIVEFGAPVYREVEDTTHQPLAFELSIEFQHYERAADAGDTRTPISLNQPGYGLSNADLIVEAHSDNELDSDSQDEVSTGGVFSAVQTAAARGRRCSSENSDLSMAPKWHVLSNRDTISTLQDLRSVGVIDLVDESNELEAKTTTSGLNIPDEDSASESMKSQASEDASEDFNVSDCEGKSAISEIRESTDSLLEQNYSAKILQAAVSEDTSENKFLLSNVSPVMNNRIDDAGHRSDYPQSSVPQTSSATERSGMQSTHQIGAHVAPKSGPPESGSSAKMLHFIPKEESQEVERPDAFETVEQVPLNNSADEAHSSTTGDTTLCRRTGDRLSIASLIEKSSVAEASAYKMESILPIANKNPATLISQISSSQLLETSKNSVSIENLITPSQGILDDNSDSTHRKRKREGDSPEEAAAAESNFVAEQSLACRSNIDESTLPRTATLDLRVADSKVESCTYSPSNRPPKRQRKTRDSSESESALKTFATGAIAGVIVGSIGMFAALVASAPDMA